MISEMLREQEGSVLADNEKNNLDFDPIDVSEPRAPRKEKELIKEALAQERRDWLRVHMSYIFAVAGVVIVALIAVFIYLYYQSNNPMGQFIRSIGKDFNTSFDFSIKITEDNKDLMRYNGTIEMNRSKHTLEVLYDADYDRYTYIGAVHADDTTARTGSLYQGTWTAHDCFEQAQNFFEFDRNFSSGSFDGGSFLRFTGLTSDYSASELERFFGTLRKRLSTDSAIATITSTKSDEGTRYDYDISLQELLSMIQENGAPVFYRVSDYDKFSEAVIGNSRVIENAECTVGFFVDSSGYMTQFDMTLTADGTQYGLSCTMENFGTAQVELPQEFLDAAALQ